MASFPCLEGFPVAANSRSLFDRMMLYFEREESIDFDFVVDLHNLWVQFIDRTNDKKLFISELDGLPPSVMSYNCCQFLHQFQENDFIKLLELRKMIVETYSELHKKLDFVSIWMIPVRMYLLLYYVHGDDEVGTWILDLSKKNLLWIGPSLLAPLRKLIDNVKILQSCNGLLLCGGSGMPIFDYVYNPSTNQYKKLPYPDCSLDNSPYYSSDGLRIAFDPTKSPHYKLVDAGRTFCALIYKFILQRQENEASAIMHYNLNIQDPDHPIITAIPIPQRGMTFLKSYGYMDPMQILIQMSHLLHLEGKLFEWRGSLFLVCLDDFGSREFTIYETMIGCSVWMVRYHVHTDDFMTPLPEGWSIRSNVWSIVLGEKEQDLFLLIKLSGKVVQYNLISKTLHEIYDCGSNQVDDNHDDDDDELLQQF
ncbi:hypothetical protein Tco_0173275 [Tanacetum coccineum]